MVMIMHKTIELVSQIGCASIITPYTHHKDALLKSNKSVIMDKSRADLVFQILNTCGRKETDEKNAAR